MTDAVVKRGRELPTHNWKQGERLSNFGHDPARERELVLAALAQFEQYTTHKPKGWLANSLHATLQTADILADRV